MKTPSLDTVPTHFYCVPSHSQMLSYCSLISRMHWPMWLDRAQMSHRKLWAFDYCRHQFENFCSILCLFLGVFARKQDLLFSQKLICSHYQIPLWSHTFLESWLDNCQNRVNECPVSFQRVWGWAMVLLVILEVLHGFLLAWMFEEFLGLICIVVFACKQHRLFHLLFSCLIS